MKAIEHPEYIEEKQHLKKTSSCIETELGRFGSGEFMGSDRWAAQNVRKEMLKRVEELKKAAGEPYFGRVDVANADGSSEAFYIGKFPITESGVFSWQERTLVAELYYTDRSTRWPEIRLLLKRNFEISGDDLREIVDSFLAPEVAERQGRIPERYADTFLLELLRDHRSAQLRDIVATIQAQQYEIIRSPKDQVLVVQGGPGSGKTQVALHRLSYLLYQYQGDTEMRPQNTLVLGPTPVFMDYIARVLPDLGNREILQLTFDGWLKDRLGEDLRYERQHQSLEHLLDPSVSTAEKVMDYRNSQNKGSLKMGEMLERYVALLEPDIMPDQPLKCVWYPPSEPGQSAASRRGPRVSIERSVEDLRKAVVEMRGTPFNLRRERVEERLAQELAREVEAQIGSDSERTPTRRQIERDLEPQIHAHFDRWRSANAAIAYRRLLRTPDLLREAGKDTFNAWELEMMTQDAPTALTRFRFHDLAPLLYLKLLLDGPGNVKYDHVVVDEAQDLSPLAFKVLATHCRVPSMTILGDLAQGIYLQHAATSWETLIAGQDIKKERIGQVYRSTAEIVNYANAVLREMGLLEEDELPQPISRSGPEPQLHGFDAAEQLIAWLIPVLEQRMADGPRSLAILCKTLVACEQLSTRLQGRGFTAYQLLKDGSERYGGRIVLAPIYLTKGLEFDLVIIADADEQNYPADDLHTRLLYVALTRAAHELHIAWVGEVTGILHPDGAEQLQQFLPAARSWAPVFIRQYADEANARGGNTGLDVDGCVERLAASEKLNLLQNGQVDAALMDLLMSRERQTRATDEQSVRPLNQAAHDMIAHLSRQLEAIRDAKVQTALALAQLVFGLLRNQLRASGLPVPEDEELGLEEQLDLLVTLLRAVEEDGLALGGGRWTTRHRTLAAVSRERRAEAERCLDLLLEHGYVEMNLKDQRIRVSPAGMVCLLKAGLGRHPDELDDELWARLPHLPVAIGWQTQNAAEVLNG